MRLYKSHTNANTRKSHDPKGNHRTAKLISFLIISLSGVCFLKPVFMGFIITYFLLIFCMVLNIGQHQYILPIISDFWYLLDSTIFVIDIKYLRL